MLRNEKPVNALTVDVEDFVPAYLDSRLAVSEGVVGETHRVLELFARYNVRGTFFVLGVVAKAFPKLLREIAMLGHEIGVHGWAHTPLWNLEPEKFRSELLDARRVVEDAVGIRVEGFRAPCFSVVRRTWWALAIIEECGFRYDSSVFPAVFPGQGYGIRDAACHPFPVSPRLTEFPLTVLSLLHWRVPAAGGGYLRFFPLALHRLAINAMNRKGHPAVVYLHPWELNVGQLKTLPSQIGKIDRFLQGYNRSRQEKKLSALLSEFPFLPMREVLARVALSKEEVDLRTVRSHSIA